jgi:hypothetical protein
MPGKLSAVMVRCTLCKEEDWAGFVLQPSEAPWFYERFARSSRFTCRHCGAEFWSEPYLKGFDSFTEIVRSHRPRSVPPPGETG